MSIQRLIPESILAAKVQLPPSDRQGFLPLDLNENYAVLNEAILAKIRGFAPSTVSTYPDCRGLKKLIAGYAGVPTESVAITNGSSQGIQLLVDLFFGPGDVAVIPSPTFAVYYNFLNIRRAEIRAVTYTEADGHFLFPLAATLAALEDGRAKGVLLCSPNNPLGPSVPENDLLALLAKTRELDIPLIVDEAYFEYSDADAARHLAANPQLIILRTFSKALGLAGARLGYVLAAPEIIGAVEKLAPMRSVNGFAVLAGAAVLGELPHFRQEIEKTKAIKEELFGLFRDAGVQCYRTDANFLVGRHPRLPDFLAGLHEKKILINDISRYPFSGLLLQNAFRITIPARRDLDQLKTALADLLPRLA